MKTPTTVLFDANSFRYLRDPPASIPIDPRRVQEVLVDAVDAGSVRVLATPYLLQELWYVSERDHGKFRELSALLRRLSRRAVLDQRLARIGIEHRHGGAPDLDQVLLPFQKAEALWGVLETFVATGAEIRALKAAGERSHRHHEEATAAARRMLRTKGKPSRIARRWHSRFPGLEDDWCQEFMKVDPEALGLPRDPRRWPEPASIPSYRNHVAYLLAHTCLTLTGEIPSRDTDNVDAEYYSDATYADVLVTNDKDMTTIIGNINRPVAVRVQRLQEFVVDVLGVPLMCTT